MKQIKSIILKRIDKDFTFLLIATLGVVLLFLRVKLTHSFFYTFLVWNLVLAWVPYGVCLALKTKKTISKGLRYLATALWLLFLPNAPYLVTDFIHLQLSPASIVWYDALLILSFAVAGLYCYIVSVQAMYMLWQPHLSKRGLQIIHFCIPFITAFGIYLGRFLRFNSWDVITAPQHLFQKIGSLIFTPADYTKAWVFIIVLGTLLYVLHWIFQKKMQDV